MEMISPSSCPIQLCTIAWIQAAAVIFNWSPAGLKDSRARSRWAIIWTFGSPLGLRLTFSTAGIFRPIGAPSILAVGFSTEVPYPSSGLYGQPPFGGGAL